MNYRDILISELQTEVFANSYMQGFATYAPKIIDTLTQIIYFCGKKKDIKTLEGEHYSYCFNQYLQIPYSFRACLILYERGHYLEACFIVRYLFETLVKMKYLGKHKDFIQRVWAGKTIKIPTKKGKERRLLIRDMFEEVSPGFYERNYGRFLSGVQHSGIAALLFRTEGKTNKDRTVRMGSTWDERTATYVINNFTAIGYCYLNNFPRFFPEGFAEAEKDFIFQYDEIIKWLKGAIRSHKRANAKSEIWYEEMRGLM
ncbi:MAG: hypothetical protein AAB600_02030 [Patescibacteria group bacterium]